MRFDVLRERLRGAEGERTAAALQPRACFALDREIVELTGGPARGDRDRGRERSCFYRVQTRQRGDRRAAGVRRVQGRADARRSRARRGVRARATQPSRPPRRGLVVAGRGVLLVGPKQSGKTTLLVDAWHRVGRACSPTTRLRRHPPVPRARSAYPRSCPLRTATRVGSPACRKGLPSGRPCCTRERSRRSPAPAPERSGPTPINVAYATRPAHGRGVADCAPIAAIVFPRSRRRRPAGLSEVSREDGASWLRESLYGIAAGPRTQTVSRRRPPAGAVASRLARRWRIGSRPGFRCFAVAWGRCYGDGRGRLAEACRVEPAARKRVA